MSQDKAPVHRLRPVVLCVLDGWGHRVECDDNAICQAHPRNWERLEAACPHALLDASELHVGLPEGQMGNSEVGHMNIGAGRVVMQELPRIDQAVRKGAIPGLPAFRDFVAKVKAAGGTAHVMGLLSPGGVHSHQAHFAAMARDLAAAGLPVAVHGFLDGRDTPPRSALEYLARFEHDIAGAPGIRIATIGGRYYGMDRDKRWERVALAYDALVDAKGERAPTARDAIEAGYARNESDEFVKPTAIGDFAGMKDGDGVVMINFRADRARQILTALLDPDFDGFARGRVLRFSAALGMSEYSDALAKRMTCLFPPQALTNTLGELVSKAGLHQLRIAETEKYAHVTFFFNGGEERQFPGEERILVPSPKVATYDLQPEMSAPEVTDKLVAAIGSGRFDFIVVNYANTDMVGHTGDLAAAVKAVHAVDEAVGRVEAAVRAAGGAMIVTADHGNAETMRDQRSGQAHTAHTMNLVPVVLCGAEAAWRGISLANGQLADVAPTVLALMGLPQPKEMTGRSLLRPRESSRSAKERTVAA
ncbi:MAG: 2,3-bisphosphoglycerate-independent phosphoglycerate mutase [Rhodospirillaceae bacterium]|nr:2,3-bisphosphoglycerate-independent phosphoglycerate mutase [Rhodospirillaceae bacterium]